MKAQFPVLSKLEGWTENAKESVQPKSNTSDKQ